MTFLINTFFQFFSSCTHIGKNMVEHGNATSDTICRDPEITTPTTPRVGQVKDDGEEE